uniref:ALMS motif domain-containing protein n=1 Tax=Castor canadensis TaxID=51338 RepID=A0A8C0VYL5_CASCN
QSLEKVIQDSFASPDLPLLTCLTQDQEFGPDSLFHQSELDFAPLRGILDKSEDNEGISRPSEVSEALFQATSEGSSDIVNSCFSISQHPLTGSTTIGSQHSFLPPEQGNNEENVSCNAVNELKTPKDSDSYHAYISWKTRKDTQQPESNLADEDQVSGSTLSDSCDENLATRRNDGFDDASSHVEFWKQEASQLAEICLTKGLQGKAESDVITLDGDPECCNLDENAVVCSERVAELQREPTREPEYHSSNLRMLRVSPDTLPKTLKHLAGVTSEGSITEVTQSKLKSGVLTTPGDSDIRPHLSLSLQDLSQLAASSPQENAIGQHIDTLSQKALADSHLTEESLKVADIPEPDDQNTGIPTAPAPSYSHVEKPDILYQEGLPEGYLTGEPLAPCDQKTGKATLSSTSYPYREKPNIFYQQALPDSFRSEEALKSSALPRQTDQRTGILAVPSFSHSRREKPGIFYQQAEPEGHLPEEALKISAPLGLADQNTGIPPIISTSFSQKEKPNNLYQQGLPDVHLTDQPLTVLTAPGQPDQKTGIPGVTSTSHTQRDKPDIFYHQSLPGSHLPEETPKASATPRPADLKNGISTVTSISYTQRDKPGILYQQTLPGSHLPKETLKASGALSPADQKTGTPGVTSTSYTQRDKPGILYQQSLPGSHLPEETLKASAALSPADQMTGTPGITSTSYTQRDKPVILYQQFLPDSHLPEETLKASAALRPADQKIGTPGVTSVSYTQRDKSGILYQQPLPGSVLSEETLKTSATPRLADQKTGISGVISISYTPRDKPGILYQQPLPGSHLSEDTLKASAIPRPVDQKTGIPAVTSTSYTQRDKPGILYQQSLPGSHLPEEILKASAALSPDDQKTGILPVTSTSYSYREEPGIFYQKELSESHFTDESLNVSAVPESSDQKTGIATVSSTAYPQGEKSHTFYHQALPESYLSNQAPKVSGISGSAHQKFGTATVPSTSYSHEVQPGIYYQHELPDSHLPEETLKVSAGTELADQKAGIPTGSSSPYSHGEKSSIFYQQELPDLPTESLKTSAFPRPADQKSEVPTVPSISHSYGENPIVFYQQELPDSHPTEKFSKVLVVSGPIDQKTGVSTISSPSDSHIEKPVIFYQQTLLSSHPPEEVLKGSSVSGPADQIAGAPTTVSSSYSYKEKPSVFYQQMLPDSHLTENALNISDVSGPPDQKTETLTLSSTSYSQREKPGVFYQQAFPDSHLTEELLNVSAAPRPADQKTSLSTVTSTSYSQREKPGIFYQQTLPGSQIPGETLKVSASRPTNQKTGLATITSTSYSQRDKPGIFYQQALPGSHIPGKSLKVSAASRPADQKTGIPTLPSSSYSRGEKSIIFYQHALPDSPLTKDTSKVSAISGPVELKTETPTGPSDSNLLGDKSIISYSQTLPESHLTTEALNILASPGSVDLKTGKPTVSSSSYSSGEKPSILYQQALPDTQPTKGLKVSIFPEPVDQKIRVPTVASSSYSNLEKTVTSYQQELPDSHLTEKAVNVSIVPGPTDQKTGIPIVPSTSYSHREKPGVSYQQEFPDLTEEALKVLGVHGSAEQNNGIQIVSSTPYSHREKSVISYQQELPDLTVDPLKVLGVPRLSDQKIGIHIVPSTSYPREEKPIISYQQEVPALPEVALKTLGVPGSTYQKTGIQIVPSNSYLYKEKPNAFYQQKLPNISEEAVGVFVLPGPGDQNIGTPTVPLNYYSHREKPIVFSQKELPVSHLTEEPLKVSAVSVSAEQKTGSAIVLSSSYSDKEKLKISTVSLPDDQKTELPTATHSSYLQREKSKISTVIGLDDQKTPLTVFHSPYSQRVRPGIFFQQQLSDTDQSGNIQKSSTVPEPTDIKTGVPVPLSGSYFHREKANIFYSQGLPDRHLTENALTVSTIPEPANQKTVLPTALPGSFSHRERYVTKGALKVSSGFGQTDGITGLPTGSPGIYSHGEAHKLVSGHVLRLTDNLNSSYSSVSSNNMPLNSQAVDGVMLSKPESSGLGDVGAEEIRDTDNSSKTLKEIRTLLMEAENIALKRCNFPAPLVPFRDVSDISFIQSKKMVCFKEPSTTDVTSDDLLQRQLFTEESQSNRCIQKDIGTQTNLKCQRGIENWEFISSTTIRSPLQEAENKARMQLDETFRQYEAAKSIIRSEPEGYSGVIGNKIIIPMMTIIKSDSSSDVSDGHGSCSWDSNLPESLESVSDVLLNFLPYASPKTSIADSREEDGVSDSEDGCGSVDSLAAHVKNLLQCESSLNHARQILRNAEEEECRVRARAWNLKFNLAHDRGYPTSELNDDDRRKVEEIKTKLFGHGRTTDLSEGLQSPRGIGGTPDAVCSHIIIESHEKGCFRTLTAQQPQVDSHPCVFRSAEPSDVIRGRRSPTPWRTRHINFSKSLDQNNSHFRVWNSLQLQSHPPFQSLMPDDFKVSKGLGMPFHENIDPWLSELVEPACVSPKEVDFHSSSQILPPEPMKQFTTSITFSSHRHSKCISDSSVFKVGVTEGSQYTGAPVGVFNSHVTEEQNSPRYLKQRTSSPLSFKKLCHLPNKEVTILAEGSRQSQKLSVDFEHSHQEEKLLEKSDFEVTHSEPSTSTNYNNFKEVHFSDNHTPISMGRPCSTLGVREKNVIITSDLPSHIFLEQRQLFEQSQAQYTDHYVRKHHSPPCPNLPSCIFLEQQELFEQSKVPHLGHEMRENHSPFPQCQDNIAPDLSSPIFLEQRQSKPPAVDAHHFLFSQSQDSVVEKNQHAPDSHICNMINVEATFNDVISQSVPDHCKLAPSASTPPSNRKALSCIRITLCPKTSSKLDSGILDKRFHSLDPASRTNEFNSHLQIKSTRSLESASILLTSKPIAQDQESLGFLGPKSPLDLQVVQSPPDSKTITQNLKTIPSQNSQIVTSRQTQVNFSDLEEYSKPEETPVSADGSREQSKTPFSASSGKLSSDAVTQITTESPGKTTFSSEIFINADNRGGDIPEPSTQKLQKPPVTFASSSSVQESTTFPDVDAQPVLLPYKPPGSKKMYYVPQLATIASLPDSKSDTTIESSHSGSNDAIAPDFPVQVLGTRDDDLSATVNIKHKEGIYSKRARTKAPSSVGKKSSQKDDADAPIQVPIITSDEDLSDKKQKEEIINERVVTKVAYLEEKESLQRDTTGSSIDSTAVEHLVQVQDTKIKNLPDTKAIEEKEEIHFKRTVCKEAWPKEKESLQTDISEPKCHSEFENTTHSVFRSAKFYFHHPVHPSSDQDFCHESLGKSVFMRHSCKDFFQQHSDNHREPTCLPPSYQNVDKTKTDYMRIKNLSINVNLGNKEMTHTTKSQARDHLKSKRQINDAKRDHEVSSEPTTQHTASLNELWNKYQERHRQRKPPDVGDRKELSLIERLDRLAKLLQNPITHSLQASESTQDDSRGEQNIKDWSGKQKSKLQKQKRYKSLEKGHKNISDLKRSNFLSPQPTGKSNQVKIEQVKFDKYILRKQPDFNYINTPTNVLSTTPSPVDSDILTQTDREVTWRERSSSISTIDTARLIQAFGHERVCLSPRQIKLYSSITNQQRRYLEKRCKHNKKALSTGHPLMTSEHTRRRHIQEANQMISSDSVSSASSFLSLNSTLCNKQNVHILSKGIQAGNLEIVNGAKKNTRDVGMTFPTPSPSEAKLEEDSVVTSWSEERIEEKMFLTNYLGNKKLKNKQNSCEGVSWFVPVENVKSGSKKENFPKNYGPGVSWFESITKTKPWREPLREQNWQGQCKDIQGSLSGLHGDDGQNQLRPFVRTTLQESLQLHRPDFISRSGERIKRLKLIVQERKLQNMFQCERNALFNATPPLPRRVFLLAQKNKPIGKKEMIQHSKRIYEQLPEVQKKREEERRKSEYKSYRLRAQLYKKKVTNQLLGRKVPWD